MRYLIDTNIAIGASTRRNPGAVRKILNSRPGDVGLSTIVMHELSYGVYKSERVAFNEAQLDAFIKSFVLVPFDAMDARHAGDIRATLKKAGSQIGPLDTLIAGQARARGLILITNNVREFARVPGLDVVDWTLG